MFLQQSFKDYGWPTGCDKSEKITKWPYLKLQLMYLRKWKDNEGTVVETWQVSAEMDQDIKPLYCFYVPCAGFI